MKTLPAALEGDKKQESAAAVSQARALYSNLHTSIYITALQHYRVCQSQAQTAQKKWCYRFPGHR